MFADRFQTFFCHEELRGLRGTLPANRVFVLRTGGRSDRKDCPFSARLFSKRWERERKSLPSARVGLALTALGGGWVLAAVYPFFAHTSNHALDSNPEQHPPLSPCPPRYAPVNYRWRRDRAVPCWLLGQAGLCRRSGSLLRRWRQGGLGQGHGEGGPCMSRPCFCFAFPVHEERAVSVPQEDREPCPASCDLRADGEQL